MYRPDVKLIADISIKADNLAIIINTILRQPDYPYFIAFNHIFATRGLVRIKCSEKGCFVSYQIRLA